MRELCIVGLGELGQLYGAAALRAGLRVTPVTRGTPLQTALYAAVENVPILVAVGETDLDSVLSAIPDARKDAVILLQNELFPAHWERHGITPTVMVPWILKKRGQPVLVARPTPVYGRFAKLTEELHQAAGFAVETLRDADALKQALVDKYAFILTVNALGLLRDANLETWLAQDPSKVERLAREAAELGAARCGFPADLTRSLRAVTQGMAAMGAMRARGRSAGERLERALAHAAQLGLEAPALHEAAAVR